MAIESVDSVPAAQSQSEPSITGQPFGDYQLMEELGRGGMGVVFKAMQRSLNRPVALKMTLAGHFARETDLRRFRTEAEAAAKLAHANILPIHEVGEIDGNPFYCMKWVEGGSLSEWVGRLSQAGVASNWAPTRTRRMQERLVKIVIKVARAVSFAHQHAILHRDIKPSNILMDAADEPLVADFGLAKCLLEDATITATEVSLGSPEYMSPEQASGNMRELTTASDVYSLGVVLYELLTGRVPFKEKSPLMTLQSVIHKPPPALGSTNLHIDRDLETICLKCLEKEPGRRYRSAEALADDLECWLEGKPINARPVSSLVRFFKWVRREPWKAALVVAIATTALGTSLLTSWFYLRQLPHMAFQHPVATANESGVFILNVRAYKDDRVSQNFWSYGFDGPEGKWLRLDLIGIAPELTPSLRCVIKADQPGRPDPPRSPVLTNGQMFRLRIEEELDRNFYVASVGWSATNLIAVAPHAHFMLTLVSNNIAYRSKPVPQTE